MSPEETFYKQLSETEGTDADTIELGTPYYALNFDLRTNTDLGKCLRNEWNDAMEAHYTNDNNGHPDYRFLTFETRNYPTKEIIKK